MSYAKAIARTPQSDLLHCFPISIILTTSFDAGLNTMVAISLRVDLEIEGYKLS